MCIDCKNNCLEEYSDMCILYTGPDFDRFNIKNGEHYSKIIVELMGSLEEHISKKVELGCVYTGECDNCDTEVEIPKAVELIIDKLCSLTASEINYEGDKYCIGDSSISGEAIKLLGKRLAYEVGTAVNGSTVYYDLSEVINTLPSDYRVSRVNSTISGKIKRGKTLILDSDKKTVGATISNDRYPLSVDIDIRVSTPSGDVKLTKVLNIPSPIAGSYTTSMNVKDFGTDLSKEFSLESFTEMLAAQVCSNKSELKTYKELDLPGCEYFSTNSTDIKEIVAQQNSVICELMSRIERLENLKEVVSEEWCK